MTARCVLTPWVTHDGGAIYSLDVSPNEYKLATCGNGEGGEGVVIIWNLLPMISEKHGKNVENENPLLARIQMTRGVNSVRWSRCGRLFAAASDDKTVSVWEYGGRIKSAGTIGMRKEEANMEKYRCVHSMHGHSMEVLAVEWSWDGRFLASASIDNNIIVWNALKLPERVVVLDSSRDGHTGSVKGISFDPIGKYLVSQSADKTLRVWSTENWTCEVKISDPFEESAQSTMFMRPDWSPDGKLLVAPCAMNNGGPTSQIIMRGSWDARKDLVGFRKAATVARCAHRCFEYEDYKGRIKRLSLFAVGSRDKSISIWALPGLTRPILTIANFFKHSIMDITWKGSTLICCSQDGTVKTLMFNEAAVGRTLRTEEMSDLCYELYRTRPPQYAPTTANGREANGAVNGSPTKGVFIETAADLIASRMAERSKDTQKESREREREEAEKRAKAEAELVEKRKEQVENRTKDGKRRIQPVFLCSTIDNTVQEKPVIPDDVIDIEKEEATAPPKRLNHPTTSSIPKDRLRSKASTTTAESSADSSEEGSSSDGSSSSSGSSDEDEEMESEGEDGEREGEGDGGEKGRGSRKRKINERDRLLLADFRRPVMRPLERLQKDSLTLAAAELQKVLTQPVSGAKNNLLVAYNEWASSSGVKATRVTKLKGNDDVSRLNLDEDMLTRKSDREVWTTILASPVLVMTANAKWVVLTCADCSLHVLSGITGAVLFMLQLDSLPAQLGMQDSRAYVLTSNGYFSCWDLTQRAALFSRIPVLDIVSNDVSLHSISLSPSGAPLISFSNGSTYSYSASLQSWFLVDACSNLSRLSAESMAGEDVGGGTIAHAIRNKKRPGVAPTTSLATRAWVGQAQLESWIFTATDNQSMVDLESMVWRYTEMLITSKSSDKIRELVMQLDAWVERSKRKEKKDEWMNAEKIFELREKVRKRIADDLRVKSVLKEAEDEGKMIF